LVFWFVLALSAFAATLRRVPLFNDLSEPELELIAARVSIHRFEEGVIVFSEGDICRELWIVKEGSVKILKTASSGRNQLLGIERAGNSLSEVPVFDRGRYPATALTESATTLLRLEADHFRKICLHQPEVALKVIAVLGSPLEEYGQAD
jgi:CRP-like cAMP-binding protein